MRIALERVSKVHFGTASCILREEGEWRRGRSRRGSVVKLALLAEGRGGGQQEGFGRQLGLERGCAPHDGGAVHVRRLAVAVLPRQAGAATSTARAGDERPAHLADLVPHAATAASCSRSHP